MSLNFIKMDDRHIIIFDGVCNFCNAAVIFIIRRDPKGIFSFTPMQSDVAQKIIENNNIQNPGFETFLLIKNGRCYERTDAALEIAKALTGFWYLFLVFKILPRKFRDYFYNLLARNRYALFGRSDVCMVPAPNIVKRFIV